MRIKRSLSYLVLGLILFISCNEKPGSRYIEINGKMQYVLDTGAGKPVAVFVAGLGDDHTTFSTVQPVIAKTTRTISYDRAGLGKSEKIDNARTVDNMAFELDEILQQYKITDDFLLIGHSLGGLIIRQYVNHFPGRAEGIILIEQSGWNCIKA